MPGPLPRLSEWCTYSFLPIRLRPSPSPKWVGTWHMLPQNDFMQAFVFGAAGNFVMFRPASLLATQVVPTVGSFFYPGPPWLLRPRISRFVTSPSSGYANRLNRAIDGRGTFALQDLRPCRPLLGNSKAILALALPERTPRKPPFGHPSATRWRPPLTRGDSGVPSTQRPLAVAACSKA